MDLSVIILNYKSARLVRQCLKTIRLCAPKLNYEVIVVDNDSGDGCEVIVKGEMPEAKFIPSGHNAGYAAGNNLGLKEARGRYSIILNPDITARPGSLEALVGFMDNNPDIGIAAPRLEKGDGSSDESCYRYPSVWTPLCRRTPLGRTAFGRRELDRYLMADFDRRSVRDVDWLLGAAMIVRREALGEVGSFDERYFMYFEDADWCRSFRKAGWRVTYFPESKMVHYHEKESAKGNPLLALFKPTFRAHIISCIRYFRKWGTAVPPSVS